MKKPISKKVSRFIFNNIICRYSVFGKVKINGGLEFKGSVIAELRKLGIYRYVISVYNSKANRIIERGYQSIIIILIIIIKGGKIK